MVEGKCGVAWCNAQELSWLDWVGIYLTVYGPFAIIILLATISIVWIWKR